MQFILENRFKKMKKPFYYGDFETKFRNKIFVIILVSLLRVLRITTNFFGFFSSKSLSTKGIWKSISEWFWRWYFFHENKKCYNDHISEKNKNLFKIPKGDRLFFFTLLTFRSFWNGNFFFKKIEKWYFFLIVIFFF